MATREQLIELDIVPLKPDKTKRSELRGLFDEDEDIPVILGDMEEHDAWKSEKLSIDEGGRFCGKRFVGSPLLDANGNEVVGPITDPPDFHIDEDELRHPGWNED